MTTITNPTAAQDLDQLCEILNSISRDGEEYPCDMSNLPSFGGDEPGSTLGIFSWDESRVLIQTESGWELQQRTDVLNFHSTGDVFFHSQLIGRIDTEGDWQPEDGCAWTEDDVRADLVSQIDEYEDDWPWTPEQLKFAGVTRD